MVEGFVTGEGWAGDWTQNWRRCVDVNRQRAKGGDIFEDIQKGSQMFSEMLSWYDAQSKDDQGIAGVGQGKRKMNLKWDKEREGRNEIPFQQRWKREKMKKDEKRWIKKNWGPENEQVGDNVPTNFVIHNIWGSEEEREGSGEGGRK